MNGTVSRRAAALASALLIGCVSPSARHADFPVPQRQVFGAAESVIAELGLRIAESDPQAGLLTTAWQEHASEKTQGGLLMKSPYRERQRFRLRTSVMTPQRSRVRVLAERQERPPAGRRALRWQRLPADGESAAALLEMIGTVLELRHNSEPPAPPKLRIEEKS